MIGLGKTQQAINFGNNLTAIEVKIQINVGSVSMGFTVSFSLLMSYLREGDYGKSSILS
jgi:hypothetical protein